MAQAKQLQLNPCRSSLSRCSGSTTLIEFRVSGGQLHLGVHCIRPLGRKYVSCKKKRPAVSDCLCLVEHGWYGSRGQCRAHKHYLGVAWLHNTISACFVDSAAATSLTWHPIYFQLERSCAHASHISTTPLRRSVRLTADVEPWACRFARC